MLTLRHIFILCLSLLFYKQPAIAQNHVSVKTKTISIAPKTKEVQYTRWSIRAGANLSVIYLGRNIKENNNEPGYSAGVIYEANNFLRFSGLYTHFNPINIAPTWENIKANTAELNIEIMARFPNKKTLLYPFVGLSYNTFRGYFTGQRDYLDLKNIYIPNTTVANNWLGVNVGLGFEHNFGILGLYIDYRMRVGRDVKSINVMDVCYTAGLKIKFPYGKYAKKYFGSRDRYNLQ